MTGLPASGKTTAARRLQAESGGRMRRVNLDDLRQMLDIPLACDHIAHTSLCRKLIHLFQHGRREVIGNHLSRVWREC